MGETSKISKIRKRLFPILTGITILVGNIVWLFITTSQLYSYNFTRKLYYFMYPTWVLLIEIIFALIGIYIGQLILRNKIKTLKWFMVDLLLGISGIGISIYIIS